MTGQSSSQRESLLSLSLSSQLCFHYNTDLHLIFNITLEDEADGIEAGGGYVEKDIGIFLRYMCIYVNTKHHSPSKSHVFN